MTVTVYCPEEKETFIESFSCQCEGEWSDCPCCKGTGKVEFTHQASEFTLTAGNFSGYLQALGEDKKVYTDYCGSWNYSQLEGLRDRAQITWFEPLNEYKMSVRKRMLALIDTAIRYQGSIVWG